jgi:hypothetical protein
MGRLLNQFCAACDVMWYQRPSGQSLLLFMVGLLRSSPAGVPHLHLDPDRGTVAHVRILLEQRIHRSKTSEIFLVLGLIRAIENVLEDCTHKGAHDCSHWSLATQRLLQQGTLIVSDGELRIAGGRDESARDCRYQAQVDLDLWRERTQAILEQQNLDQAIGEELADEED